MENGMCISPTSFSALVNGSPMWLLKVSCGIRLGTLSLSFSLHGCSGVRGNVPHG